jgi:hypothetical protein
MKTKLIIVSVVAVLVLVAAGGLLLLRGNEDNWICENGAWIKHGNPREARPETLCGNSGEKIINQSENILPSENGEENPELIGGDRDEHGCLGSAGYTWCEEKKKCLRTWEEECPAKEEKDILAPAPIPKPLPSPSSDSPPKSTPDSAPTAPTHTAPATLSPDMPRPLPLP